MGILFPTAKLSCLLILQVWIKLLKLIMRENHYCGLCGVLEDQLIWETYSIWVTKAGAATVRIGMPSQMESSLIFHYNLKLYDTEADVYDGVSLKRFVMQSVSTPVVSFRVHAPSSGAFLLDVFANAVTPREYLTGEPMKFKSVCKVYNKHMMHADIL